MSETKLWMALDDEEWKAARQRGIRWTISKDCSTVTATDPNMGKSAKGRTLCAAVRGL